MFSLPYLINCDLSKVNMTTYHNVAIFIYLYHIYLYTYITNTVISRSEYQNKMMIKFLKDKSYTKAQASGQPLMLEAV